MVREYLEPARAEDSHALPDVELFYLHAFEAAATLPGVPANDWKAHVEAEGWYFAFLDGGDSGGWCFGPVGPYPGQPEALAAAREQAGVTV